MINSLFIPILAYGELKHVLQKEVVVLSVVESRNTKSNKTSTQWTPRSQIDRSNQKIIFSKKTQIMHKLFLIMLATNTIFID